MCGFTRDVEIGHVDGDESHGAPENLIYTCRSCNVLAGLALRNAGLGRPVRQYNPSEGATSVDQWVLAVTAMRGESADMSVADAVEMIKATPPEQRSEYAKEIWKIRRRRYGQRGHSGHGYGGRAGYDVPF